jgi:hypothetical protein
MRKIVVEVPEKKCWGNYWRPGLKCPLLVADGFNTYCCPYRESVNWKSTGRLKPTKACIAATIEEG